MAATYIPERGDLVWIAFDPQAGHEQAGRRPGLVITPHAYNAKAGLALICPVTSQVKGYPFEVALPVGGRVGGVVLADQVRSLDWAARQAEKASKVDGNVLAEVLAKIEALIQ
ncbi:MULTISPECIES: endoribonuclease MazF [unclassified Methylobacter]|jgi:mRNA interferase MazF|uniref:endoribonuclease MazF n=1 Tax=unclassified Methylobacter TaxID=2635283 RepID=UPI001892EF05|nr:MULTISPECIES: endoribonuclease MazF [unclassified Methylobacter]MBF6649123.1 endoribonuclease MazF [Methylobacter sp. BlB1]WAK04283.1 endoribonuclease MazF [Methylobacter sp. YRD-M1]